MKAIDIKIDKKYTPILVRIDHYRDLISSIIFEPIFEPLQLLVINTDNAEVKINSIDDIISWHKELSYSFVTKVINIENEILYLLDKEDIYSASILLRHHMEQCGYITLAMEIFLEYTKNNSLEILEKFIAKTSFGSSFCNNKKFKNTLETFAATRTPKIIDFIDALDRFINKNLESNNKKLLFSINYSALNHFAHPSSLSSIFFVDSREVENGHIINFKYEQNNLGDFGKYNLLKLLEQNIIAGYTSYFVFNSFEFKDNKIVQSMEKLKYSWENIINYYEKNYDE